MRWSPGFRFRLRIKREMQFLINVLVFAVFAYSGPSKAHLQSGRQRLAPIGFASWGYGWLSGAGRSLLANLFGYIKLAQFLGILCLYSTFIAISMLTGVRVFTRLLLEGIDTPRRSSWRWSACYRDGIVRWVPRVFQWAAF